MSELESLKKKIIYRANYRGTKEMDMLLGKFVNKYINTFNRNQLEELYNLWKTKLSIIFIKQKKLMLSSENLRY